MIIIKQITQNANSTLARISIILTGLLFLLPSFVAAQTANTPTGNGFRISPVRQEFIIEKGQAETFTITVENPSGTPLRAQPVINNFIASEDEGGEPRLLLDADSIPPANDFATLVSPLDEITIEGRERKEVQVTVAVPSNANAGGYYGAIRFVPVIPTEDGRNVALTASVGTIVLVQVPGDLTQQMDLLQLSAAQTNDDGDAVPRNLLIGGDINVFTRLRNSGNIHVKPFGKVIIENFFGDVVYEYEFNDTDPRANVLPDSIRKFVDEVPKDGMLGRYTIKMNLTYGDGGGNLISAQTNFWYFPTVIFYLMILGVIALAVGINLAVYKLRQRRK